MGTRIQYVEQGETAYQKQIILLQIVTIVWMCVEAAVAVFAALRARSVALLGFGLDSAIELISAFVVFLRFKKRSRIKEINAARTAGVLLFALAAFILTTSLLALEKPQFRPDVSYLGIALLIAAAVAMPWLAARKRILAATLNSGALKADAVQSSMCGYLAWIALVGLILNALFRLWWADPIAALLLLPIIVREGWEAVRGKPCVDCSS